MRQLEKSADERRAQIKKATYALRYGASVDTAIKGVDDEIVKAWVIAAQAKAMEAQAAMWQHSSMMPVNNMEVVLLKSAVMMLDVMGGGVPEYWGKPYKKTKHLYYWKDIKDSRTAKACLSDKMWDFFPAGSFFVSWTNQRGTERHHIGDAKKFSMCVGAPRFGDNFIEPFFMASHDDSQEEEWQGKWEFDEEDNSE
jgi:hypothetical protein